MLEDELVPCPVCDKEISVKINRPTGLAKDTTYYTVEDCPNCKASSNKIERMLNSTTKRSTRSSVERSYIKTDPRG